MSEDVITRTGLGEEGAEALVGIGGLALFCEITIGLKKEQTRQHVIESCVSRKRKLTWMPCSRQYSCGVSLISKMQP